ncbi:MAG: hypothetical protein N3D11_04995 [Candidatus Sumerlaeia bacterium]|nr:hypothetical protein [Candidatus Sumerlaeia bacterium]
MDFLALLGGAFLLSVLHGLIPNHWVPFVLLGRDRGWRSNRVLMVTLLGGIAHISSTILIGVLIAVAGLAFSQRYEEVMRWLGPAILLGVGLWVFWRGRRCHHGHHHAEPFSHTEACHHDDNEGLENRQRRLDTRDMTAIGALLLMMFLSPCLELEFYYLSAVPLGWKGIAAVSVIYMLVTVGTMLVAVGSAARGLRQLRWSFFEKHERKIGGAVLILLALWWAFFPL